MLVYSLVQSIENISDGFTCFRGTVFENGLDAAFASHKINEAYFFKDEYNTCVLFVPGSTDMYPVTRLELLTIGNLFGE